MAPPDNGDTAFLNAQIPAWMKREVEKLADRNYSTMSAEVRKALAAHIERAKEAA